jgi:membrane associated rhomboid family serine protease
MIPLRDNIPSRKVPVVNYAVILACIAVFVVQAGDRDGRLTFLYGMIPARISQPDRPVVIEHRELVQTVFGVREVEFRSEIPQPPMPVWLTVLSCIFLHGSLMHLAGNLWFLWIFGDNVEDRLGHLGYLLFYLGSGILASLSHYWMYPASVVPTIGASGAVAGVMGAYLYLYPRANVVSLVPILMFLQVLVIPAPVFLGLWFLLQLWQGTFAMGAGEAAGVAWWAHIGGFAVGFAVAWLLGASGQTHPRVTVLRPATDRRFRRLQTPWD